MSRQYLACRFRPNDKRAFTYHNDGPPCAVGDVVRVPDRHGEGWNRVTVSAIVDQPAFPTKPVHDKVEPEQPDLLAAGDAADSDRERGA